MENHHREEKQNIVEQKIDQDHISTLPNSILCIILSSLSTREAVNTSVLSSKWRHVWTTPNNLILDAHNMLSTQNYSDICHLNEQLKFNIKCGRTKAFVAKVNDYLSSLRKFQPHKIEMLRICFTIRRHSHGSDHLPQWLSFAIGRNVEEIDLCLWDNNELSAPNYGAPYVFPCCDNVGNNSLKCLRLAHCALSPHKAYNNNCGFFTTLTTLDLMKVDLVSGENIQMILASCHSLEWLSLTECYNMDCLKIEQSFCKNLKYLNVSLCRQLRQIVVKSNILETLEYTGSMVEFKFDAPKLRTFFSSMSDSSTISSLAFALPHLETLFMECNCNRYELEGGAKSMINTIPRFPNLRHLMVIKVATFRHDSWWIAVVLRMCPTLRRLEVHLKTIWHFDIELGETRLPPNWPHDQLKEVAITGIRGYTSEIEMAMYLAHNACALQKMTIDPRPRIYLGNGKCGISEHASYSWNRVEKHKFHENLKQAFCSSQVELLIL